VLALARDQVTRPPQLDREERQAIEAAVENAASIS
jgi:hypothetical protein